MEAIVLNLHKWDIHNHEQTKMMLDYICSNIASRFKLYDLNGMPRRATIIEVLARYPCLTRVVERLSEKTVKNEGVDSFYKECHRLAVNILVEELFYLLTRMGYKIAISTEIDLDYGKADILITLTNYGLSLKNATKRLIIEVKTGNSISFSQIFRYLLDSKCNTIIVWRVRKRQVLVFNAQKLKPLLVEFARMIYLRAERLLSSEQMPSCQHMRNLSYQPSQQEIQQAFEDFSEALVETLPVVLEIILKQLGIIRK